MSYNIDHSNYVTGRLSINRAEAARLRDEHRNNLPEGNFLDEIDPTGPPGQVEIHSPWWYGEGSGHAYDLLKEILACTKGTATILFVWEGGDSQTALKVCDGKVAEGKLRMEVD